MGVQSTINITREDAIARVEKVVQRINDENYRAIEIDASEHEVNWTRSEFIHHLNHRYIDKFTNRMLEDMMDLPYFRYSMYENYCIVEESNE